MAKRKQPELSKTAEMVAVQTHASFEYPLPRTSSESTAVHGPARPARTLHGVARLRAALHVSEAVAVEDLPDGFRNDVDTVPSQEPPVPSQTPEAPQKGAKGANDDTEAPVRYECTKCGAKGTAAPDATQADLADMRCPECLDTALKAAD